MKLLAPISAWPSDGHCGHWKMNQQLADVPLRRFISVTLNLNDYFLNGRVFPFSYKSEESNPQIRNQKAREFHSLLLLLMLNGSKLKISKFISLYRTP